MNLIKIIWGFVSIMKGTKIAQGLSQSQHFLHEEGLRRYGSMLSNKSNIKS
jgi:hypothetical protein